MENSENMDKTLENAEKESAVVTTVMCSVGVECKTMYEGVLMNARVTAEYGDYYDVEIHGTGYRITGIPKSIWRPHQYGT